MFSLFQFKHFVFIYSSDFNFTHTGAHLTYKLSSIFIQYNNLPAIIILALQSWHTWQFDHQKYSAKGWDLKPFLVYWRMDKF